MIGRLSPWLPAAAWAAVLFYVSSREQLGVSLDSGLDKVAHFGAYLILGALLATATVRQARSPLIAMAIGLLYGASDEFHQAFVPGRSPDVLDWFADAIGVIVGVLIVNLLTRSRQSPHGEPLNQS